MATDAGGPAADYQNPFRNARVSAERVDMGADFQGRAGDPVYALGPGVIVAAGDQWRGAAGAPVPGTWIAERLTSGPWAGRIIYTAEDITPAVQVGQRVTADTVMARFTGAGQLETGIAEPPGTTGQTWAQAHGGYTEGQATRAGQEMRKLLTELGVPEEGGTSQGGGGGGGALSGCVPAAGMLALVLGGLGAAVAELGHMAGLF